MTESDEGSAQEVVTPQMKKGCCSETMQELVDCVRCFLGVSVQLVIACMWSAHICKWNPPHAREETVAKLCTMFEDVASGKGKTRYTKSKTENGIKATYMDVFIMQILKCVKCICAGNCNVHVEHRLYQTCQSVAATNGEICNVGDFVLAELHAAHHGALPTIGQLHEILQICHSPAVQSSQFNIARDIPSHWCHSHLLMCIQSSGWVVLPAMVCLLPAIDTHPPLIILSSEALLCVVNVQHNCAVHQQ